MQLCRGLNSFLFINLFLSSSFFIFIDLNLNLFRNEITSFCKAESLTLLLLLRLEDPGKGADASISEGWAALPDSLFLLAAGTENVSSKNFDLYLPLCLFNLFFILYNLVIKDGPFISNSTKWEKR